MTTRLDRELEVIRKLYEMAIKPFQDDFHERCQFLDPSVGSPKWRRERDLLKAQFKLQIAPALALRAQTETEIEEHGEMSEETSLAWDALIGANNHQTISVAA